MHQSPLTHLKILPTINKHINELVKRVDTQYMHGINNQEHNHKFPNIYSIAFMSFPQKTLFLVLNVFQNLAHQTILSPIQDITPTACQTRSREEKRHCREIKGEFRVLSGVVLEIADKTQSFGGFTTRSLG